ncbi:MAG TPA: 3-hydroxybutyrate oligomer hydrolase family protein [Myxococcales bacterium]
MSKRFLPLCLLVAACHTGSDVNDVPSFVVPGSIATTPYDGSNDDLLTGGLGFSGLISTAGAPALSNPPTAAELRTRAIYTNYRALVDVSAAGGYGTLYGPNVDVNGNATLGQGMIAGEEWLAYDDDGSGRVNATMMVQVPSTFVPDNPCIVTATSSGSRGVYGAIATAGEWGLKHRCAVAYTDKGSGMGVHDLQGNTVDRIDGRRQDATAAGKESNFTANLTDADRTAYNLAWPNRFAVKHAHSQNNPEKDWGLNTLHAIEFAYYVLNQKFGTPQSDAGNAQVVRKYHPGQILTIAASVSNGAGASLAAAEQDPTHWISGVVVGEPQVQVASTSAIQRGSTAVAAKALPLYDYMTTATLYQGCAAGATGVPANMNPLSQTQIDARCSGLTAKGLLTASTQPGQSNEALQRLQQAGYESDSNFLHATHFSTYATPAVALTYANAYARASVTDNLCGYSFAFVDGANLPTAVAGNTNATNALVAIFATGSGVPPMGALGVSTGIQIINNNASPTPKQDQTSTADSNLDGAGCLRSLWTGTANGSGAPLTGNLLAQSNAVKSGVNQVLRSGRLRGIPTILVQGRNDTLVPVNHASRAYLGANKMAEGANSPVYYYEVTNAQHFDAFITNSQGYQQRFIPLHRYVIQALDLMYAHLKNNTAAIPPSQVVRTTPRCTGNCNPVPPIAPSNVPPITGAPGPADQIVFSNGTLVVPD